jgi:menaquinone-dependent protoporphyrinogen oxidase
MHILVMVGSRFGSAREIAEAFGARLRGAGYPADVRDPIEVAGLAGYDAVVLSSGIYNGKRTVGAAEFARNRTPPKR